MADGNIEITLVNAEALARLVGLLERLDDGDVWSVQEAADELREILSCLHPLSSKR